MGISIRDAYGNALVKYGKDNKRVVVLDADVSSSTKSGIFAAACPDRFYNVGIAEQNMVAMAAGMAATGKIPFVNTFAIFLATLGLLPSRGLISYAGLNVKLMGAYAGLSDAYDGASHHSVEDIAIFRSIPGMIVLIASDAYQTDQLVKIAIEVEKPMYIRLSRDEMDDLYTENDVFEIGKGKILKEGKDVTLIGCGIMSGRALEAAVVLQQKGIDAKVVDMFTIKPLDKELINACATETGAIVTAEEHSVIGGLGGAVSESLAQSRCNAILEMVGVNDTFTESGDYASLLGKYGMSVQHIVEAAERAVKQK